MARQIFREKSIKYISSPEELTDYLKVTKPTMWAVLGAIIVLLAGLFICGSFTYIGSSIGGTAKVKDGVMILEFEDQENVTVLKEGMTVTVGDIESQISSVGKDENGDLFATASTTLMDGTYEAKVTYKQTQVLGLLFGSN